MRCKFCFATFQDVKQSILPKGHLPEKEAIQVVHALADIGFDKITFAGGEPLLCPWLGSLIKEAHHRGLTTMIVSNGSCLTKEWLEKHQNILDWITLSIDSLNPSSNLKTGRAIVGKKVLTTEYYSQVIEHIHQLGFRLKINTVVSSVNYLEDMAAFIQQSKPERWKLFQVLPIQGQNDACVDQFLINQTQFNTFVQRHQGKQLSIPIVAENNQLMTASYAMVDPAGRFFDNSKGHYTYSDKILDVGPEVAYQQVVVDSNIFAEREGQYDW